ncbi:EamA family transporter RarD [Novosphingobium sp.]|uniref:EamA family transporter RarD n=1 Tax=Novosphingobium sp. TaxID=1874826 RepID=UPI002611349A|nr:EamA family transporter RarD [Novosphingobium sp.]
MTSAETFRRGLVAAICAYICWGLLPLYFKALHVVPPLELVGWRVVFTLPVCMAIVMVRGQLSELRAAFANPRVLGLMALSALLIATNWLIYVIAINTGHVLATSLGYYINPLINVVLGTVFLGERLSRVQWGAVVLAGVGIALLLAGAVDTLAIALTLAVSFAFYGFVRKQAPVGAVPGLTIETTVLFIPAIAVVAMAAGSANGSSITLGSWTTPLIVASGIATAVPLLLFAVAARSLPLSTLGFVQFIAPTISFMLGLIVFGEELDATRLASFALIWAAIALYSWDMAKRAHAAR